MSTSIDKNIDISLEQLADIIMRLDMAKSMQLLKIISESSKIDLQSLISSGSSKDSQTEEDNSDSDTPKQYNLTMQSYDASAKAEIIKIIAKKHNVKLMEAKKIVEQTPFQISEPCDESAKNEIVSLFDKIKDKVKIEIKEKK